MKKLILAIAVSGLLGAPLMAQEVEESAKTPQEMMEELHKLMKKASDEMGELEEELAKASLDSPKADVVATRIEEIRKKMAEGKLDELPEGLRKYIEENPEAVAKELGKSEEEVKDISKSSEELAELLKKNPELLKKLAENQETMESIVRRQHEAEKKLEETLKKQQDSADQAKKKVDESLELAHAIKQQGQGQGQGQPKNDKSQSSNDPRNQGEKPGDQKNPSKGAEDQYKPGEGEMDRNDQTEEYERGQGDGFQADKKGKDMGDGASNEGTAEPSKYKGFWKKWNEESRKKSAERKSD